MISSFLMATVAISMYSARRVAHHPRTLLVALLLSLGGGFSNLASAQQAEGAPAAEGDEPAASPGQADLDEAVIQRIDAGSVAELEAVAALLESALTKGLDEENQAFAKKMLGSVQLQRGQGLAAAMMRTRGQRQLQLRDEALYSLQEAVSSDPSLVEGYMLIARLNLLPGGDRQAVQDATSRAIELLDDEPAEQSAALVLRALTQAEDDAKLADLDLAIQTDPSNTEAYQARAALRLQKEDVEGAVKDLEVVLLKDPTNLLVASQAIEKLTELGHDEKAEALLTDMLEAKPSEGIYRLRAILYRNQDHHDKAISDLNKAIAMQPGDPLSLLLRAETYLASGKISEAKVDLQAAEEVAPQLKSSEQGISLRAQIAIAEERYVDAINYAKEIIELTPEESPSLIDRRMFLASLYALDKRPRKAIDVYSALLNEDPKNSNILRARADLLLAVGDHAAAVKDYETAIQSLGNIEEVETTAAQKTRAAGVFNNLSWVLATSPVDSVRDATRSLEYAEKAARLTDYKKAYILSTLAAAYAEAGEFEKAVEWSSKAVEMASNEEDRDHDQLPQLKQELESYQQGKPWREKQETEENAAPILDPNDLIEA